MKKIFISTILAVFLAGLFIQPCFAGSEGWKERQDAMMKKHGLKAGEVYDASNLAKIKHLLPVSVQKWVAQHGWKIPIGEFKYYYGVDDKFFTRYPEKANIGKYALDERDGVIEVSTGKFPVGRKGIVFPMSTFDMSTDPKAAHKLLHNVFSIGASKHSTFRDLTSEWVGDTGYERSFSAYFTVIYYQGAGTWRKNPNLFNINDMLYFTAPYDIEGTVALSWKYLDSKVPTKGYIYVPVIRRVKRTNGANRSDPTQGSDMCTDDSNAFNGDPETMDAKVISQQDFLMPVLENDLNRKLIGRKAADGTFEMPSGYEAVKANYVRAEGMDPNVAPWVLDGVAFVPRTGYQVELFPRDPYYNYGKQVLWLDREGMLFNFKEIDDRSGEYWKTIIVLYTALQYADDKYVGLESSAYLMVDDKAYHGNCAAVMGSWRGYDIRTWINSTRLPASAFTPQNIQTMSR
ncbi:MAG: DUF1329 domain-containing protein [Desulfobacteraceae bacterium]|mgnify:CR=1 FL=1|nr:DUF1329 domain-containing protein [Desulfobacteraceae bacterium]